MFFKRLAKALMSVPSVLDGGWGWAAVGAGAINNFLSMGFYRSGGIIYLASLHKFQASRTIASWIPMVTLMIVFLTAPVGTALCKRFSYHSVTFCGGLLASVGMFICFLANRIEYLFIGWGMTFGLGSSLAFFPSVALVGQYFKKRRPLANGIVLTGGALGAFCLPPLLELLVESYGLNGATLITCGVTLHYMVASYLLLLVSRYTRSVTNRRLPTQAIKERELKLLGSKTGVEDPAGERGDTVATQQQMRADMDTDEDKVHYLGSSYEPSDRQRRRNNLSQNFKNMVETLDLGVICNHTFIVNCASNAIQTSLMLGLVIILPDFGEDEVKVPRIDAAYFVSASAISDLSTRFISGWVLTRFKCRRSYMYFFVLLAFASTFIIMTLTRQYAVVMLCSVLAGTGFASGMILYFEILASCQSVDKYPMAFGLSELMKAPLLLVAASSVGTLKDTTGSYSATLFIFSGLAMFAASLWILECFISRRKDGTSTAATVH